MGVKEIENEKEFYGSISEGVVLVDFSAPWCVPCRLQEPIIEKLATAYQDRASVYAINVDHFQEIAANLQIRNIPTLIIFKDGKEMERIIGLQTEAVLAEALRSVLEDYTPKR